MIIIFDYEKLLEQLLAMGKHEIITIGQSVNKRNIYCIKLGNGPVHLIYNGVHHSLEWITGMVLTKYAEQFDRTHLFDKLTIHVIPMVNPDGIEVLKYGVNASNNKVLKDNQDFKRWQANIRGVDLNHNYDAKWEEGKKLEAKHGIKKPGPTRFGGYKKHSEPEVMALVQYTEKIDPTACIAFHSQGKEIYWEFRGKAHEQAFALGDKMAQVSGYKLKTVDGIASYGGYKDWVIDKLGKMAFTVELGVGKNPLPLKSFDKIYEDAKKIMNSCEDFCNSLSDCCI